MLIIISGYGLIVFVFNHVLFSLSSGPSTLATFVAVYALFGPTFPGIYDNERGIYTLFYPVCNLMYTYIYVVKQLPLFFMLIFILLPYTRDYPLLFRSLVNIQTSSIKGKVSHENPNFPAPKHFHVIECCKVYFYFSYHILVCNFDLQY